MPTNRLSITDGFGFHSTRQMKELNPKLSESEARGVTWGYNFRKILTYIPLISVITGIMTAIILACKKSSPERTGLIIRSLTLDLFMLGPLAFIIDMIVTLSRKISMDSERRINNQLHRRGSAPAA